VFYKGDHNMDSKPQTPPYVSYATFKNNLRSIATGGVVPSRIDPSLLGTLSGSSKAQFMAALRFFELIGRDGVPSAAFKRLAISTEQEWKSTMSELLGLHCPDQVAILASGTPRQLQESFGEIGGIAKPAARFFILAAKDAGIAVGPHLAKGRGQSGDQPRRAVRRKPSDAVSYANSADHTLPPAPELAGESYEKMLLRKFPQFDPSWDPERQKSWFTAYQTLLEMGKAATADAGGAGREKGGGNA
jgi:hypothetical protein